MDKRISHLRFYRGILLPFIALKLSGTKEREVCDELHVAFKEAFSVDSTALLSHEDLRHYTAEIRAYMASEHGVLCPIPADKYLGDVDEMEMKEFLKSIDQYRADELRRIRNDIATAADDAAGDEASLQQEVERGGAGDTEDLP